jgi:3-phosphoshikimate 1-carboxyvinyltransferase
LESDDTEVCAAALRKIGVEISIDGTTWTVEGVGGRSWQPAPNTVELFVGNSGTTIRFLVAALAALGGHYYLHGVPRMHQRPIGDLVASLRELGVDVRAESPGDCPPVRVSSEGIRGGEAAIAGDVSSQFLSGLLMAAPLAKSDVRLTVSGGLVSESYVLMTQRMMERFGARCNALDGRQIEISAPSEYRAIDLVIEPDASAASYFWAVPAIAGGRVLVEGLHRSAWQGDVKFVDCLAEMGCEVLESSTGIEVVGPAKHGIDVDMHDISDTAQTLAAVALTVRGTTTIRGIGHNRFKETDRIADLACELRKLGGRVEELDDGLRIDPPATIRPATVQTYHDHRMAMSLSLVGLKHGGIRILDPSCTSKTYPAFFADLERLIGRAHHWGTLP